MKCPLHGDNFIYTTDCDICNSLKNIYSDKEYDEEVDE